VTAQKIILTFTTLTGGAVGLLAPIGFVKWLLQTDPEEAGILTLFFFPVWCLLVVLGLLIGRRAGLRVTGGKRVAQR
jgi:DMSO reductase anchor subunit